MTGVDLLPEFDLEMANTRNMLERVPDEHLAFKPHEKSFSLLELASHVSNLPTWVGITLDTSELDLETDRPWERKEPTSRDEILVDFDEATAAVRPVLEAASDEDFAKTWTLRTGEEIWFTMPKAMVYRQFALNHLIHHRAQLSVYLRLLEVPVPGMYGPSADEPQ